MIMYYCPVSKNMSHIPISLLSNKYSILICQWLSHSGLGGRRPSPMCRTPSCFPGVSDRHWLEGRVLVAARTARLALTVRTVHPGDVHFYPGPLRPPPPLPPRHISYNIVMVWADRKDWNPTKQKRAKHAALPFFCRLRPPTPPLKELVSSP